MKIILTGARMVLVLSILLLSGCVRLEVATPEKPITINMNVKIEHEIQISVDKDVENLLRNQSNLF
jgi:YnbE-like lipoprotein